MPKEEWIESTLSNDEASTDKELIEFFISEGGLSESEAKEWVGKRNDYLSTFSAPKAKRFLRLRVDECPCCLGKFDFVNQIEYSDEASGQSKEYCPYCSSKIFNDWSGFHEEDGKFKPEHLVGQTYECTKNPKVIAPEE